MFSIRPELRLDPLALHRDQFFLLTAQIADAVAYFRPPLEPTAIGVNVSIIARFPTGLPVSGYARLRCRSRPAIPFLSRVPEWP
jgi:hypothetical protein